jgi:predicted transcriptional regulator
MSLSKQKIQDKIEIVGKYKNIQIRYSNQIMEDGEVISNSYDRYTVSCGDDAKAIEHNVKAIADIYWTDEIKEAYQASLENPIV